MLSRLMRLATTLSVLGVVQSTLGAAPAAFPSSGNGLWFQQPAGPWAREWLPIGNGYLGAMLVGGVEIESTQLNIESMWNGGPFQDPTYNGGNFNESQADEVGQWLANYRSWIFGNESGTIEDLEHLMVIPDYYGSYTGAGFLLSTLDLPASALPSPSSSNASLDYARWLDLDSAVHGTTFTLSDGNSNTTIMRESFCSNPVQACVQHTSASPVALGDGGGNPGVATIPPLTFAWSNVSEAGLVLPNVTCMDDHTLMVRGLTSEPGMLWELIATVAAAGDSAQVSCDVVPGIFGDDDTGSNATISVMNATDAWVTWVGGTDYDMDAGDATHSFSFKGVDPHPSLMKLIKAASTSDLESLAAMRAAHVADFQGIINQFQLDLGGPTEDEINTPTDELKNAYEIDTGSAYLEWVTFNLGRYMLVSSARGTLPTNLQGKWAWQYTNPWDADYHADINLQMSYWIAEMTALGNVTTSLWNYIEKTWAPRGAYTAQVLYNVSRGWVVHDEINTFGHSGMKDNSDEAMWTDYSQANAWMMLHVWDHFDYSNDVAWFQSQGYPTLKGVALFFLDFLIPDEHFNDGTFVIAPCNSPEQVPITFGCTHAQQMIWMLFNAIEKGFAASGDTDAAFLAEIQAKKAVMDHGVHIGSWGQLQEWKMDMDSPTDLHRHLSHLVGVYPGYAVVSYADQANYTKDEVIEAATISLIHRGNGTADDNAGWEKAWRAAAWAQLGNTTTFYHELTYALYENFANNLFSIYTPTDPDGIFQIDANLGFPAAVMNALLQAPDTPTYDQTLVVTLLPTLPEPWATGSFKGARVRGGITVDVAWADGSATTANITAAAGGPVRPVQVMYDGKMVAEFSTGGLGMSKTITF